MEDLRYPIGKYQPKPFSIQQLQLWLLDIKVLPLLLENALLNLDAAQLDTPYREDGWKVKQVVHHVADSHMQAYTRLKLGLTEDNPTIRPYDEVAWAELSDNDEVPVNISLTLLHALHTRWHNVWMHVSESDLQNKTVSHPASQKTMTLWYLLGMYVWHGQHHVAHITSLRQRMGW
jgi:uncharacterized damage-inducible protein DinB